MFITCYLRAASRANVLTRAFRVLSICFQLLFACGTLGVVVLDAIIAT